MPKLIFVNLPVTDLGRSVAFYEALGGVRNPAFSDETAACMVFSETIHAMLLTHAKYGQFTARPIADAHATSQVMICVSAESRADVNDIVGRGAAAGGTADPNAPQDHGFMYGRSVEDPDGHVWEVMWMDAAAIAGGAAPA